MNAADYQTLIVKFSKPITELDGIFDDAEAWGVETLKGWVEDYESSRFTAIDLSLIHIFEKNGRLRQHPLYHPIFPIRGRRQAENGQRHHVPAQ